MSEKSENSIFKTSNTLLDRVKNPDDKSAWNEFVNYYEQYIYNIIRHIGLPEQDAQELCQDTLLKLWKKLPDFVYDRNRGKFRSWLGVMIRNQCNRHFQKQKRKETVIDPNNEILEDESDYTENHNIDMIIENEWNSYISNLAWENVKKRFKENSQKAFLLHLDEVPIEKIAEECNIKSNTVYVSINRVQMHLKEEIKRLNEELL